MGPLHHRAGAPTPAARRRDAGRHETLPHVTAYEVLEAAALAALPRDVYDYYAGGAGRETSVEEATGAWARLRLRPRVLRDVRTVDPSTTLLGDALTAPLVVAPCALHALAHPSAEVASAAGAREAGAVFVLSTRSSLPMEDVAAVAGPWWLQVYVFADRRISRDQVQEAAALGARALVLTGDTPVVGRKRRDRELLGPQHQPARWAGIPQARDLTLDDIALLSEASALPVLVKGVLRGDDARACVDAGAAGVVVSNHGGRQLDGAVAVAEALPEVVESLGERGSRQSLVLVDGGLRTGTDLLRALALGADAVGVARPVLWALAAGGADGRGGAAGVRAELERLAVELEHAMTLAGASRIDEVTPDLVVKSR